MKKLLNRLEYWLLHEARYYHKDFITGIKNLWRWFPLIWKDRDWDDHYIWILLEKKLTHQAEYIGRRGIHLNANRDAERMMTCARLIKKVREEYYHMEYMDYHKSEYHWDDVPGRDDVKQLRIEELSENFDNYFKKYPLVYKKIIRQPKVKSRLRDKCYIAMQISRENHERARKLLFKLMERHIESWWD